MKTFTQFRLTESASVYRNSLLKFKAINHQKFRELLINDIVADMDVPNNSADPLNVDVVLNNKKIKVSISYLNQSKNAVYRHLFGRIRPDHTNKYPEGSGQKFRKQVISKTTPNKLIKMLSHAACQELGLDKNKGIHNIKSIKYKSIELLAQPIEFNPA